MLISLIKKAFFVVYFSFTLSKGSYYMAVKVQFAIKVGITTRK